MRIFHISQCSLSLLCLLNTTWKLCDGVKTHIYLHWSILCSQSKQLIKFSCYWVCGFTVKSKACFAGNSLVKCSCILTQSRKWDGYFCAVVLWLITHIFEADCSRPTLRSDWLTTDSPFLTERQAWPEQNRRRITWEAPVPHPARHQVSFGSLDGSRSRRLLAQSLVQSLSVQHHAVVEICRYQVVLTGKHRRVTLTGNACLTSSCHDGCIYQRVFDGEVETFFGVSFQIFNKLEIFLVPRLHVGQHLHTLTTQTQP